MFVNYKKDKKNFQKKLKKKLNSNYKTEKNDINYKNENKSFVRKKVKNFVVNGHLVVLVNTTFFNKLF